MVQVIQNLIQKSRQISIVFVKTTNFAFRIDHFDELQLP